MIATVRLVALTAFRDRLFVALLAMLGLVFAVSIVLGSTALIEHWQMVTVFAAATSRFLLILGLIVFVAFHVQRLFETKEIEAVLSRSLSRGVFVVAYWLGFAALAAVVVSVLGVALYALADSPTGLALWTLTVLIECFVVIAVGIFAGLMLGRATSTVMFTLGFYALARLMGLFIGIRHYIKTGDTEIFDWMLDAVFLFIPRLDLFAQTSWLVYGSEGANFLFPALQGVAFLALVLTAAIFDLRKRQF